VVTRSAEPAREPVRFTVAAILFDIDGTLVDSTGSVVRTWRRWADAHDLDAREILRVSHGRRSADTVALFLPAEQVPAGIAEIEALEQGDPDDVTALPATASLLALIPPRRWAAVTSGPRSLMQGRLTTAGLPTPAVLIAAEDVVHGKPDPEGYLAAAAGLGVDITECLVIEDSPAGIEAGRAAGAHVLAVATSHPRSALVRAHAVVEDLTAVRIEVTDSGLVLTARPS
jgi:sugar-phosphatase